MHSLCSIKWEDDELKRMWKEVIIISVKEKFQHFPEGIQGNHKHHHHISRSRFKHGTSRVQSI